MWATLQSVEVMWAVAIMFLSTSQVLTGILLSRQTCQLNEIGAVIMGLVDDLNSIKDQLSKAKAEIVGKIADLETANANAGVENAEVTAAVASLKEAAQGLDDVVADAVAPVADESTVTE